MLIAAKMALAEAYSERRAGRRHQLDESIAASRKIISKTNRLRRLALPHAGIMALAPRLRGMDMFMRIMRAIIAFEKMRSDAAVFSFAL